MTGGLVKKNYQFGSKINTGQGRVVLVDLDPWDPSRQSASDVAV